MLLNQNFLSWRNDSTGWQLCTKNPCIILVLFCIAASNQWFHKICHNTNKKSNKNPTTCERMKLNCLFWTSTEVSFWQSGAACNSPPTKQGRLLVLSSLLPEWPQHFSEENYATALSLSSNRNILCAREKCCFLKQGKRNFIKQSMKLLL